METTLINELVCADIVDHGKGKPLGGEKNSQKEEEDLEQAFISQ